MTEKLPTMIGHGNHAKTVSDLMEVLSRMDPNLPVCIATCDETGDNLEETPIYVEQHDGARVALMSANLDYLVAHTRAYHNTTDWHKGYTAAMEANTVSDTVTLCKAIGTFAHDEAHGDFQSGYFTGLTNLLAAAIKGA